MIIRLLYVFIIPAILSCSFQKEKKENSLSCIEGINLFPQFDAQGIVSQYDTGLVRVYSYKNRLYLYELPRKRKIFDSSGSYKLEKITNYILFNIDSAYGYHFDSGYGSARKLVRMDSLFKAHWLTANKIWPYISANASKIIDKKETSDSLFVEYEISKSGTSVKGMSLQLYFAKSFLPTTITLSKEIDSLYNIKLVKAVTNIEPIYIKEHTAYTSRFIITTSIRQVADFDKTKVIRFFSFLDASIQQDAFSQ